MTTQTPPQVYQYRAHDLTWQAPSDTVPDTIYTVSASAFNAELTCSCPATRTCKHIRRAIAGELGKPRVRCTIEPKRARPVIRIAGDGFGFISPEGM